MDKIVIIIVNWNTGKLLADCVRSCLQQVDTALLSDIVVIDNASSDNSLAEARAHALDARIHWLPQNRNLGFAAANNVGITYVQNKYHDGVPHVLLLNPDTVITTGALENMLAVLQAQSQVGVVGPTLLNPDGTIQPSVRAFPTFSILLIFMLKLTRWWPNTPGWRHYWQRDFNYAQSQTVDQVMGAAFLIRNDLLNPTAPKSIGLLDEKFFVWFEEVDYCRRAISAGWQVCYTPAAQIVHYGGVSFAQLLGFKKAWPWLKSLRHYARQHLSLLEWLTLTLLTPISLLLTLPASIVHRRAASLEATTP